MWLTTILGDAMSPGYIEFLSLLGMTEEGVQKLMAGLPSPVPNPEVDSAFALGPSPISGYGLWSRCEIPAGERFPVCQGATRYLTARYINHSDTPSMAFDFDASGGGWATALYDLPARFEVTADYRDTFRKSLAESKLL